MKFAVKYGKSLNAMLGAIEIIVIGSEISTNPVGLGIIIKSYTGVDIAECDIGSAFPRIVYGDIGVFKCAVGYAAGIIIQVIDAFGKRIPEITIGDGGIFTGMLAETHLAVFYNQI